MNKNFSILFFAACGLWVSLSLACNKTPSNPVSTAANTVTATTGDVFSPTSVTITHGSAVTFVLGGGTHSLYIDNGSGTCAQSYTTWPQVITFPTAGTFSFHCQYHSPCGTSSCSSCTGMTGQVIVN
jgi:plastocyanin